MSNVFVINCIRIIQFEKWFVFGYNMVDKLLNK